MLPSLVVLFSALLRLASAQPSPCPSIQFLDAALPSEENGIIRGFAPACDNTNKCNAAGIPPEEPWMIGKWYCSSSSTGGYCTSGHKDYCIQSPTQWDDYVFEGVAPVCPKGNRCNRCPSGYFCIAKDEIGNGLLCSKGKKALCVDRVGPSMNMEMMGTANRANAIEMCRMNGHTLPYVRNKRQHDRLLRNCKQAIEMHGLPTDSLCHTGMAHTAEGLVYHDEMMHSEHFEFHNYATHDGKPVEENFEPQAGRVVVVNAETGKWETVSEDTHAVVVCNNNGMSWRRVMFGNVMDCGNDTSVFDALNFAVNTTARAGDMKDATRDELKARGIRYPFFDFSIDGEAINYTRPGSAEFGYKFNQYGLVWAMQFAAEPLARKALDDAITQSGFGQGIYDRLDKTLYPAGCTMRDEMMDANVFPVSSGKGKGKGKGKGGPPELREVTPQ